MTRIRLLTKNIQGGSRPEKMMRWALDELGIAYEHPTTLGGYHPDALLREHHLDLECDGWYHRTEAGRTHDAKRDEALLAIGYRTVRLDDRDLNQDVLHTVRSALLHAGILKE